MVESTPLLVNGLALTWTLNLNVSDVIHHSTPRALSMCGKLRDISWSLTVARSSFGMVVLCSLFETNLWSLNFLAQSSLESLLSWIASLSVEMLASPSST